MWHNYPIFVLTPGEKALLHYSGGVEFNLEGDCALESRP